MKTIRRRVRPKVMYRFGDGTTATLNVFGEDGLLDRMERQEKALVDIVVRQENAATKPRRIGGLKRAEKQRTSTAAKIAAEAKKLLAAGRARHALAGIIAKKLRCSASTVRRYLPKRGA